MKNKTLMLLLGLVLISACEGFLDEKPSKRIIVPTTIDDLYSILANVSVMNRDINLGIIMSDDMFTTDEGYLSFPNDFIRDAYKWQMELYEVDGGNNSWSVGYRVIFHSNLILETIEGIHPLNESEAEDINNLRGISLFHRASALSGLMQFFAPPVLLVSDLQKPGIPIKLDTDVNNHQGISTVGEVYDRIFQDLIEAETFLPQIQSTPLYPNKAAANGMMARLHLILGNYALALEYSQSALDHGYELMDYQDIAQNFEFPLPMFQYPIPVLNKEIIYYGTGGSSPAFTSVFSFVTRELTDLYNENDLRRYLYFTSSDDSGNQNFIGHYTGDFEQFSGLALDELYLIKAECLARLNRAEEGIEVLNELLETRFMPGTYEPIEFFSDEQALDSILLERRKTLVFRGYSRWSDMRRFLKNTTWEGPPSRTVLGETYELGLSPEHYTVAIPLKEFELNPGIR